MLTIERLRQVNIPLNASNKPNNLSDNKAGLQLYNDSINLYEALSLFSGTSVTDLTNTPSASTVVIDSSTGLATTILAATTSLAGVMSAQDKTNLGSLVTLSGVAASATNLGTFTGSIIADNSTIKAALQSLETATQLIPVITKGNLTTPNNAITITNGALAVIGSGTQLTFNPSNVLLSTLGGTLNYSQLSTVGATTGQLLTYNGTSWTASTYTPTIPTHNTLTGKQGGTTGEYYHLDQLIYDQLNTASANIILGRGATIGVIEELTVTNSIEFSGTTLQLVNDASTPGNLKYYGTDVTGVKGWHSAVFSGVTSVSVSDTSEIDLTIVDPTTTPSISASLVNSGVTAGTYGTSSAVPVITVDLKGRITSAINTTISVLSTTISDFDEAVDDRVADLLIAGAGIGIVYDDVANTITISNSATTTGVTNRIPYWVNSTTLGTDTDLTFDGTYLTLGTPTGASLAKFTSKGVGNTLSTYGYVHQNSAGNEVFKVADNGAITVGSLGEVFIHPDSINLSTGGTFPIQVSGGDLSLYSDHTVVVEGGGTSTNLPSFKSVATRSTAIGNLYNAQIMGNVEMTIGGTNSFTDLLIDTRVNQTLHTGFIRSLHIKPVVTASNNYIGAEIDVPSTETALKITSGEIRFELPSSNTGDLFYRDATGKIVNLGIGSASEVLGSTGTIPAWTTTAGSLPGGTNGDFLIYSGGSWVSGTLQKEKISGITGTGFNLGVTPLAGMVFILYRNGVYQDDTDDYSIMGNSITMTMPLISSDKITAIYYI